MNGPWGASVGPTASEAEAADGKRGRLLESWPCKYPLNVRGEKVLFACVNRVWTAWIMEPVE